MKKYTNKYEVALAIAEKFGSTNDHLTNIFEALKEIATIKGLSGVYTTKYEILKALALNEGAVGTLSNSYECLLELAKIYGGSGFTNNYEAALYLLENAEAADVHTIQRTFTFNDMTVQKNHVFGVDTVNINAPHYINSWQCAYVPIIEGDLIVGNSRQGSNPVLYMIFDESGNTIEWFKEDGGAGDYNFNLTAEKDMAFIGINSTNVTINTKYITITRTIKGEIPEGWTEVSPIVVVTIDGTSVRLEKDKSFAQQGYTELYSQNTYAPRLGQSMQDFVYNVNSYPTSGLELFTTCTLAVNMINVTVDGVATQVNYYTSWAANGFNLLYTNNEFESESNVEEIDVNTSYPNEGDAVYTSYIIVPQWMKQVYTQTGIPVTNLKQAEENYTFVDYLESTGTQYMLIDKLTNNTIDLKISYKVGNEASYIGVGNWNVQNSLYFGRKGTGNIAFVYGYNNIKELQDTDNRIYNLSLNVNRAVVNGTTYKTNITSILNIPFGLFGTNVNGVIKALGKGQYIYNAVMKNTASEIINHIYIPCLKGATPIMLDLMTMTEYTNQGTGTFVTGDIKSLEEKFNEIL